MSETGFDYTGPVETGEVNAAAEPWWSSGAHFSTQLRQRLAMTLGEATLGRIEDGIRVEMADGRAQHYAEVNARTAGDVELLSQSIARLRAEIDALRDAAPVKPRTRRKGAAP